MKTIENIGASLNLALSLRGGIVQSVGNLMESSIYCSWREDFPTDSGDVSEFLVSDSCIEDMTVTTLLLKQIDGKEEVFPEIWMLTVNNGVDCHFDTNVLIVLTDNR